MKWNEMEESHAPDLIDAVLFDVFAKLPSLKIKGISQDPAELRQEFEKQFEYLAKKRKDAGESPRDFETDIINIDKGEIYIATQRAKGFQTFAELVMPIKPRNAASSSAAASESAPSLDTQLEQEEKKSSCKS